MSNLAVAFLVRVTIVAVAPPTIASGRRVCSLVRGGQASFCTSWNFEGASRAPPIRLVWYQFSKQAGVGELDPPSARTYRQRFLEPGGAA